MGNLARLFFDAASAHEHRTALAFDGYALTYGELANRVARLAAALRGAKVAERVGLFAYRSETAYAGLLAILATGSAYVPENPTFPVSRNRYIVEKAGLSTLVVSKECAPQIRALLDQTSQSFRLVALEADSELLALARDFPSRVTLDVAPPLATPDAATIDAEAAAYVLFTSGSTGNPKGVVVRHRNVRRYVKSLLALYPIFPEDRVTQTFDLTFDLSVHDLFTAWAVGAAVVVFTPAALASPIPFTRELGVSVWFSVPSLPALLESSRQLEENGLPGVRLSFFCGEKLGVRTVTSWRSVAPSARVVNLYGPTETTVAITHFEVPADFDGSGARSGVIPIGDPFPGQKLEIRRDDGTLAALGEPGALFLAGDQVTAGYLGEPELTESRFEQRDGETWYRTGDLALRDSTGLLQFLGREDFQVKVMGYRVELGEIEHALMGACDAAFAVAGVAPIRNGVEELFAVLPARLTPEKKRIREAMKALLPPYMAPRLYYFVDELPLNANGKVDRTALSERLVREG